MNPFSKKKKEANSSMLVPSPEKETQKPVERKMAFQPPAVIPQKKMMKVLFSEESYDILMTNAKTLTNQFRFENNKTRLSLTEKLFIRNVKGCKYTVTMDDKTLGKITEALSLYSKNISKAKQLEEENFRLSKENSMLLESEKNLRERLGSIDEVYLAKITDLEEKLGQIQDLYDETKQKMEIEKSLFVDKEKNWKSENEQLKKVILNLTKLNFMP